MAVEIGRKYLLGDYELEPDKHLLTCQNVPVHLGKKRFEVLLYLIEHHDRLVTREELLDSFWAEGEAYEETLTKCLSDIRKALADQGKPHRLIETVSAVGYRYIGPVEEWLLQAEPPVEEIERTRGVRIVVEEEDSEHDGLVEEKVLPTEIRAAPLSLPTSRRLSWKIPIAIAFLAIVAVGGALIFYRQGTRPNLNDNQAAPIRSIAVLPLENLSGDPAQEYFADGMTEELVTSLGQISELRVISRTSVMHYKGTRKTIPEIARELHVDAVVEGSVERAGDRVRITAQLIEGLTDHHLWARKYDRELQNALQLQDEVAQAITREIQVKLTPQEQTRLAHPHPVNPEAYTDYLQGRYFYNQSTFESRRKANKYFQKAINKDPDYAQAWALWAITFWDTALSPAENAKRSHEALQKALQLDDSLAEVHTAIGVERMDRRDWAGAESEFRRAIELNPNYAEAHNFYSHYLMVEGRVEDSLRESHLALECDPLNLAMVEQLAWHYLFAHQYDEAIAQCRKTLDMDPNRESALTLLALAYEQKGEYADAITEFQKALSVTGDNQDRWGLLASLGHAYGLAGNKTEAVKIVNQLLQSDKSSLAAYHLAILYLGLGDKQRSLALLRKAVDDNAFPFYVPFNRDPVFDSLHSDPRFQELLSQMGLPQ